MSKKTRKIKPDPSVPRKRILFDMDAILVDFFGPLFEMYYVETGEEVSMEQVLGWDMASYVGHGDILLSIFRREGFFLRLKPLPGAVKALKRLSKRYDIVICSYACTPDAAKEKMLWCQQWIPFIEPQNIVLTKRKDLIQADCIVDDSLDFVAVYGKSHPGALLLGIAYPYNRCPDNNVYNYRVEGYKDTAKALKEIVKIIEKRL